MFTAAFPTRQFLILTYVLRIFSNQAMFVTTSYYDLTGDDRQ